MLAELNNPLANLKLQKIIKLNDDYITLDNLISTDMSEEDIAMFRYEMELISAQLNFLLK